ncbi:hypothetical protein CAEBREN_00475 [Caenorhabditis brenneri]|uniref:Uncharacterized protein n=1 Tax=Caenorhabditis brenneri TaxID=135651 RepID=G0MC37_CAEBE|nr:hypothetical protein CAEBREN_00475 [Caenorhabditis brenneri]
MRNTKQESVPEQCTKGKKAALSDSWDCLMKYLPRGPHNPELTKELNQMKWCMRELSNGQNVKDFIFILFYIFAYTALVVWQLHIAFQRTFRAIDAFLNILFIGLAAVPIGMSLKLPLSPVSKAHSPDIFKLHKSIGPE